MTRVVLFILASLLVLSACSSDPGEKQVKGTVMRYNQLLVEGFRNLNMTLLQEVATPEQAQKEYYLMAALGEAKVRMESRLVDFAFLETTFPTRGEAMVKTREKWNYSHLDINTGKTVREQKDVVYELGYRLKLVGARWVVTAVNEAGRNGSVPYPSQLQPQLSTAHRHRS